MTDGDLQSIYKLRFQWDQTAGKTLIYMWPQDVIDNSIKAYSYNAAGYTKGAPTGRYFAPANGSDCIQAISGDCAPRHHYVHGPAFTRFDMTLGKRIDLAARVNIELRLDALNVFNNINFNQNSTTLSTQMLSYEVTSAYKDINNTQDPGGRLLQIVSRISW